MVIVSKNRYFAKLPTTITIKLTLKDWNFPSIEGRCQSSQNTVSEEIGPGWAPELTASTFKEVSNKIFSLALVGVGQWIERWPVNQRVSGSIPSQDTCLGCGPGPWCGGMQEATTH